MLNARISLSFILLGIMLTSTIGLNAAERQEQYWSSIKLSSPFKGDMTLLGELLNRYSAESENFTTRSVRIGLQYKFQNELKYAFIAENRTASSDNSDEIRFIHQFGYGVSFEKLKLGLRGRWEQREFSDTSSIANRLRARVKLDGPGYQFSLFTPFALAEHFQTINAVPGRPEGGTELRLQTGVSFKALAGKVSISYLDRTTRTPAYQGNPNSESEYGIVDLGLSWSH